MLFRSLFHFLFILLLYSVVLFLPISPLIIFHHLYRHFIIYAFYPLLWPDLFCHFNSYHCNRCSVLYASFILFLYNLGLSAIIFKRFYILYVQVYSAKLGGWYEGHIHTVFHVSTELKKFDTLFFYLFIHYMRAFRVS